MSAYRLPPPTPPRARRASLWRRIGATTTGPAKFALAGLFVPSMVLAPARWWEVAFSVAILLGIEVSFFLPRPYRRRRAWLAWSWPGINARRDPWPRQARAFLRAYARALPRLR